jgi:hypothetical protein
MQTVFVTRVTIWVPLVEQELLTLHDININGNISYEGIWKYRKYIIKYININYDEGIAHESFSFKIILRSP